MNTKKISKAKVQEGFKIIAMTRTWPGSWGKGDSIKDAKRRLRQEQRLTGIPVIYYLVHEDTTIDGMCLFHHVPEHPPICLGE